MKLENREWQFNNFIVEIIDTKLYKKKQKGRNGNKSLEALLLPQFFNSSDVMTLWPLNIQTNENNPTVAYRLGKKIRNNIMNYKEAVDWIYIDEEIAFSVNTDQSDYTSSTFCDLHHKNVITGNLRIFRNNKLRKLLTKSSNHREPQSIIFSKAFYKINTVINSFIEKIATKNKTDIEIFQKWKEKVLPKGDRK